jgi:hypothetical protein
MKVFGVLLGFLIALVIGVYVLAFTPVGNSITAPVVEQKIQENLGMKVKLNKFALTMSDFSIILELDSQNIIYVNGNYSLSSKKFNAGYRVNLDKLENLKEFVSSDIKGAFHTEGVVKGDMSFIEVDGKSDVASSVTSYHVELTEFSPTSIIAKIDKANLSELLSIAGQKQYADAVVNMDVNFKSIKAHELDGDISLKTSKGSINTKVMKKDFDITIPKTAFAMNLDAKLKGDDVDYKYFLKSNLANITSSGKVIPEPLKTDIKYDIAIEELALLKPISGADIRGDLKLNGTLKGTQDNMLLDAKTDFASSNTTIKAVLKDFIPVSLKAKIKALKVEELLYMIKQPHYADAYIDVDMNIADARVDSLRGNIVSNIYDGILDSKFLTKEYEFKHTMPRTYFKAQTTTSLNKNIADTKVNLDSTLANLDIKSAKFNLKDSSISSDYVAVIPKLDNLYFVSDKHMRGGLTIEGELKKAKDFDFSAHTKVAGGLVDAKLHNDDFHADLSDVNTFKLLNMLIYPEVFDSSIKAKLDYNLASQKGYFDGHVVKGKFTQNQMLDLAKQFAKVDLYKETFEGDVNADINKEKIVAALYLVGRTSHIRTKEAKIDTKANSVDAKIDINANNNELKVEVSGDMNSPKVKVDAGKILENEAKKALQKKLGDKVGEDVGNLLKSFF